MKKRKKRTVKNRGLRVVITLVVVLAIVVSMAWAAKTLTKKVQYALYPTTYSQQVGYWAAEYDVDPALVYAVIRTESGFRAKVDSHAGARGLMQMTQDTFEWLQGKIAVGEDLTFESLYEPDTAIRFGVYFFSISLSRYGGDVSTAAAAYHSGWGTVDALLRDSEYTQDGIILQEFPYAQMAHYVNKINDAYDRYRTLYEM